MFSTYAGNQGPVTSRLPAALALFGALLAVAARWYFVTHAHTYQPDDGPGFWGDGAEYYHYAWNLAHHHLFTQDAPGTLHPAADSFRDPGYPVFLALLMAFTDSFQGWYAAALISHAILGGVTVACLVLALRNALPMWALAAIAVGTALWPHSVSIALYTFSENLAAPLWAMAALSVREAAVRGSVAWTVAAGLCLAAAGLTNAVLAPLVLVLAAAMAWKRTLPVRLLALLVAVALAPVLAWSIRNTTVAAGQSSSHRIAMNLVQGSWPTYQLAAQLDARHVPEGTETMAAIGDEIRALDTAPGTGLRMIWQRIGSSPGSHIAWYASKPALLWGWQVGLGTGDIYLAPTGNSPYITQPLWRGTEAVAFALNYVIGLLALAGLVVTLARRNPDVSLLVFAVTVTWLTFVYGVLQSDPRYSTPFRGAEIALAAACLVSVAGYLRTRRAG